MQGASGSSGGRRCPVWSLPLLVSIQVVTKRAQASGNASMGDRNPTHGSAVVSPGIGVGEDVRNGTVSLQLGSDLL